MGLFSNTPFVSISIFVFYMCVCSYDTENGLILVCGSTSIMTEVHIALGSALKSTILLDPVNRSDIVGKTDAGAQK